MDTELNQRLGKIEKDIAEMKPIIKALGDLLIRSKTVNSRIGFNKNTLSNNAK